jgi:hypothetical protein
MASQEQLTPSLDGHEPTGELFRYVLVLPWDHCDPDMHELTYKQLYGRR